MGLSKKTVAVDIVPISGVLRVTLKAEPELLRAGLEAAVLSVFMWFASLSFVGLPRLQQGLIAVAVGSTVIGLLEMLRHRESMIEFGSEKLKIRRSVMGLMRTSECPIEKCSELTWREPNDENLNSLECKVGFRTIRFGEGLSERQAQEVLAALQCHLPQVAQTMGMSAGVRKSHITRLGLS